VTGLGVAIALGIWLLATLVSLAAVAAVTVSLPADYFAAERPAGRTRSARALLLASLRTALGLALIAGGVILSLPGVPGQGLLTVLAGLTLVDFPGRRRLERRLLARPGVLAALNRVRARFGRPPFQPPHAPAASPRSGAATTTPDPRARGQTHGSAP
jgi:hypothetical protein